MDTRNITKEYSLKSWAQMAWERAENMQNVRMFCEGIELRENTYYYWKRGLHEAAYARSRPRRWARLELRLHWAIGQR
jgi:hypothetical protein